MSGAQRQKLALQAVQLDFQRFDGDTGSSEVQGALESCDSGFAVGNHRNCLVEETISINVTDCELFCK